MSRTCPICKSNLLEDERMCYICGYTDKSIRFSNLNLKKIAKIVVFLFVLIGIYFHFFIYWDIGNGCFIKIKLSYIEFSNSSMKDGLKYLKSNYPSYYKEVCDNVKVINPNIACGGRGGGCFYRTNPDTISISTYYGNYINAAKVIIHETCHVLQEKAGAPPSGREAECYQKDSIIPWHLE